MTVEYRGRAQLNSPTNIPSSATTIDYIIRESSAPSRSTNYFQINSKTRELVLGTLATQGRYELTVRVSAQRRISPIRTQGIAYVEQTFYVTVTAPPPELEGRDTRNICLPAWRGTEYSFTLDNVFDGYEDFERLVRVVYTTAATFRQETKVPSGSFGNSVMAYSFSNNSITIKIKSSTEVSSVEVVANGLSEPPAYVISSSFLLTYYEIEDDVPEDCESPLDFPSTRPLDLEQGDINLNSPGIENTRVEILNSATGGVAPYTYTLLPLTTQRRFNPTNREVTIGTHIDDDSTEMTYQVEDAEGTTATTTFTLAVKGLRTAILRFADRSVAHSTPRCHAGNIQLPAAVAGTGVAPLTYSAEDLPPGFSYNQTTRMLIQERVNPPPATGLHVITHRVTDSLGDTATQAVNLTVINNLGQPIDTIGTSTVFVSGTSASTQLPVTGIRGFTYELEYEVAARDIDRPEYSLTTGTGAYASNAGGSGDGSINQPPGIEIQHIDSLNLRTSITDKTVAFVYIDRVRYRVTVLRQTSTSVVYGFASSPPIEAGTTYTYSLRYTDGTAPGETTVFTGKQWTTSLPAGISFDASRSRINVNNTAAVGVYLLRYTASHECIDYQEIFEYTVEKSTPLSLPADFSGSEFNIALNSGRNEIQMPDSEGGIVQTCSLAARGAPVTFTTPYGNQTIHYDLWFGFQKSVITDPSILPSGFTFNRNTPNKPVLVVDTSAAGFEQGSHLFSLVVTACDGTRVSADFAVNTVTEFVLPAVDDITHNNDRGGSYTIGRANGGARPYRYAVCGALQNAWSMTWVNQNGTDNWNQLWTQRAGGTYATVGSVVNAGTNNTPNTTFLRGIGVRADTGDFEAYINPGTAIPRAKLTAIEFGCGRRTVTRNGSIKFPGSGGTNVDVYTINDVPGDMLVKNWEDVIIYIDNNALPISRTGGCVPIPGTRYDGRTGVWTLSNNVTSGLYLAQFSAVDSTEPTPNIEVSRFNFRSCEATSFSGDLVLPDVEDIIINNDENFSLMLTSALGGSPPYTYSISDNIRGIFNISSDTSRALTISKTRPATPQVIGVVYSVRDNDGALATTRFFIRIEDLPEVVGESDISHFCSISYQYPEKYDLGGSALNRRADLAHLEDTLYMVVVPVGLTNSPELYSINPDTGARSLIGNIQGVTGFGDDAYLAGLSINTRRNELVLAITQPSPARTVLYGINPATGAVTFTSTAIDSEITQMHNTPRLLANDRSLLSPISLEVKGFTPVTGSEGLAPDTVPNGTLGYSLTAEVPTYFEGATVNPGPVFKDFTSNEEFLKGGAVYFIDPTTGTMYHYLDATLASQRLVDLGEVDGWYEDTETDYYGTVLGASIVDSSKLYTLHQDKDDASKLILTRRDNVTQTEWSRIPIKTEGFIKVSDNTEEGPGTSSKIKVALAVDQDNRMYAINTPTVTINDAVLYRVKGTSGIIEPIGPLGLTGFPTNSFIAGAGYNTVTEQLEVLTGVWGGSSQYARVYSINTASGLATLVHQLPSTREFRGLRGFTCVHDRRFVVRDDNTQVLELSAGADALTAVPYVDSTEVEDFKPAAIATEACSLITLDRRKGSIYRDETNEFTEILFVEDDGFYHAAGIRSHLYTFLEDQNIPGKAELIFYPRIGWRPLSLAGLTNLVHIRGEFLELTLPQAEGGEPPYRYVLTTSDGSALPEGVFFDADTRKITINESVPLGVYRLQYAVTDLDDSLADINFTLSVEDPIQLEDVEYTVVYDQFLSEILPEATGGTPPYVYRVEFVQGTVDNIVWEFNDVSREFYIPENQTIGSYVFTYQTQGLHSEEATTGTITVRIVPALVSQEPCPEGYYRDIYGECIKKEINNVFIPPVPTPPEEPELRVESKECRYEVTLTASQLLYIKDSLKFRVPERIYAKELGVFIYATIGAQDTELYEISSTDGLFDIQKEEDHFTVTFTNKIAYELTSHIQKNREDNPDYLFVFCTSFQAGRLHSLFNHSNISIKAIRDEFLRLDLQDESEKPLNFLVNSSHLAPGAVKSEDIESDQIGDEHFKNRSIEQKELDEVIPSDKLASDSVKAKNIKDCTVTGAKFGEPVERRKFSPFKPLREGSLLTEHFVDEAVTGKDIFEVSTRNFGDEIFTTKHFDKFPLPLANVFGPEHFAKDRSILREHLTFNFINLIPLENSILGDMVKDGSLAARHLFYDDFRHLINDPDYLTRLEVSASLSAKRFDLVSVIRATDLGSEDLIAVPWNSTEAFTHTITDDIHIKYNRQRFPFTEGAVGIASLTPEPDTPKNFGVGEFDPYDLVVYQEGDSITMYMVGANKVLYVSNDPDGFFRPLIRGSSPGYGINTDFEILKLAVRVPDQGKVELWALGRDNAGDIYGIYKIETSDNVAAGTAELVYQISGSGETVIPNKIQFIDGDTLDFDYPNPYGRYNVQTRQLDEYVPAPADGNLGEADRVDPRGDGIHLFIPPQLEYSPTRYEPSTYSLYGPVLDVDEFEEVLAPHPVTGRDAPIKPLEDIKQAAVDSLPDNATDQQKLFPIGLDTELTLRTISGTRSLFGLGATQVYYLGETISFTREVR